MSRRSIVTSEDVPAQFVSLANDRCEAIKLEWANRGTSGLDALTASCYLQGAADMALAIEHEDSRRREQISCRSGGAD